VEVFLTMLRRSQGRLNEENTCGFLLCLSAHRFYSLFCLSQGEFEEAVETIRNMNIKAGDLFLILQIQLELI
jgi:hypothetical protein